MGEMLGKMGLPTGGVNTASVDNRKISELFDVGDFFTVGESGSTSRTIVIGNASIVISADDTIASLTNKINSSNAGVELTYNSTADRFELTSKATGTAANIADVRGPAAQFFEKLGFGKAVELEVWAPVLDDNGEMQFDANNELICEWRVVGTHVLAIGGKLEEDWAGPGGGTVPQVGSASIKVPGEDAWIRKIGDEYVKVGADGKRLEGQDAVTYTLEDVEQLLGLDSSIIGGERSKGTNLIAVINGAEFVRQTNTFTYEGMTFNFNDTFNVGTDSTTGTFRDENGKIVIDKPSDEIKIQVNKNTAEIADSIRSFVDEYNKIIDEINGLMSQKRDRDYRPLSDEEKKAMKEDDIKAYEEKARMGILASDADLRKLMDQLRSAIYTPVAGVGITMADIGISTTHYMDGGRLSIDENKLNDALENRYDEVVSLFTKASDIPYDNTANRGQRQSESGIAHRINDIMNDAVRTTVIGGNKGYLVEKAGTVGDGSQHNNIIQKQVVKYDERITALLERWYRQENTYYQMFARMETALAQMQSQQNNLASLMASQGM
jgi:flagellar capping protein FliD